MMKLTSLLKTSKWVSHKGFVAKAPNLVNSCIFIVLRYSKRANWFFERFRCAFLKRASRFFYYLVSRCISPGFIHSNEHSVEWKKL